MTELAIAGRNGGTPGGFKLKQGTYKPEPEKLALYLSFSFFSFTNSQIVFS